MKVFENNTNFTSMRKIRLLTMLLAVLILPLISGCGKMMSEGVPESVDSLPLSEDFAFQEGVSDGAPEDFFISKDLAGLYVMVSSEIGDKWEMTPYEKDGNVLFYIVNRKGKGWELVSSDMRTGVTLACGEEGEFSMPENENSNRYCWYSMMIGSLEELKGSAEVPEGSEESVKFWRSLKATLDHERTYEQTKSGEIYRTRQESDPADGEGGWVQVLYDTGNSSTILSRVNHLLTTEWDQESPWNNKCPSIEGVKCKVGCVMVAMGQIMYYLNRNFGYPTKLYESVTLSDNIPGELYQQIVLSDLNDTSSRWAYMAETASPMKVLDMLKTSWPP